MDDFELVAPPDAVGIIKQTKQERETQWWQREHEKRVKSARREYLAVLNELRKVVLAGNAVANVGLTQDVLRRKYDAWVDAVASQHHWKKSQK